MMPSRFAKLSAGVLTTLLLAACAQLNALPDRQAAQALTECANPRPQFCTREYRPVCAKKDTGVRCITTPCPSEEWKTYGNACDACSDAQVIGHVSEACAVAK